MIFPLNPRHHLYVWLCLATLMVVTRCQLLNLPEASWAVFFLLGMYMRSTWHLIVFAMLATVIDGLAISWGDVPSFCITPAYNLLLLSYGLLWLGGRSAAIYSQRQTPIGRFCLILSTLLLSAMATELITSGGFYFLGGRFASPNMTEFISRELDYFPAALVAMLFYVGLFTTTLVSTRSTYVLASTRD